MRTTLKEKWKEIEGYENYQVSNLGNVRSLDRTVYCYSKNGLPQERRFKGKILRPTISSGYLRVLLCDENHKRKNITVHSLVAKAFVPNPNNYPCINHKDENKLNNRYDNLEWCTYSYNVNYGTRNEKVIEKMTNGKNSKSVLQFDIYGNFIKEYPSQMEVERQTNIDQCSVSDVCIGRKDSVKGFIFKFK